MSHNRMLNDLLMNAMLTAIENAPYTRGVVIVNRMAAPPTIEFVSDAKLLHNPLPIQKDDPELQATLRTYNQHTHWILVTIQPDPDDATFTLVGWELRETYIPRATSA